MNINPTRGNSRKEKRMNAIARTISGAVLIALGLTLTTWAAEPPKPQPPPGPDKVGGDGVLVDDWLFQAEGQPLGKRAVQEIGWAREMAERIKRSPGAPDLSADLARLDELQKRLPSANDKSDPAAARTVYLAVRAVKRAIMLKHPVIDFTQLLFIDQPLPRSAHEAQHRNGPQASPGGRLLVQEGLNPDSPRRQLAPAPAAPGSAFWRPDLSFDARKVLFCMRPAGERNFHLYEIGFDGTGLRQLTNSQYDDLDPIYLPDGHIMFSTGRAHTYIRCMPETTSYVLARCDADGRNIYVISRNNECDWTPALLPDGRVLYTRWEYTDKPLWRIQSLWTINQDGTGEATFWGNQSVWPDTLAMARPIPGSRRVMFVGVGHHNWFAGSVGIVDPAKGYDYPDGLTCVTTEAPWGEVGRGPKDVPETADYHSAGRFGAFQSPWPLSEDLFLVSASARKGQFDLYLMDIHGNRELIARAENGSVLHAMPVKPRSYPRQPDQVRWPDPKNPEQPVRPGILFSPDVYEGVPELPRGIVKRLRIIQQDHKTYSTGYREGGAQGPAISGIQADSVKRVLGTVPVAEDGSVAFEVPPGRALFFQLLDDKGRAVQTMRSFTGAMPGEVRGCRGCHEARTDAPPMTKSPRSLNISTITPPPWGTNVTVGYPRFVQPVIDKHCISCHAKEGKARDALDLAPRTVPATGFFGKQSETYFTLLNKSNGWPRAAWIETKPGQNLAAMIPVEEEPWLGGTGSGRHGTPRGLYATLPPMTYLSYKSRLIEIAMSGKHHDVKITGTELEQLIAWVDCNVPFRGDEEVRAMPRMKEAPVIDRFNIPQDTIAERDEGRK
jgi:hypothetical protein